MGNCRDCHNEVHAKEATDRILRLLIVKVPFEEVAEP
jgi:Zn-finger protein